MLKYIAKRLLAMIPVLVCISLLVFAIMQLSPGDPARMILSETATNEEVEALREEMGLNDPFFVQYFRFLGNALKGDFGLSYRNQLPVMQEVWARFPDTAMLALLGTLLMVVIGIPIGILSAVKQYSIIDNVTMVITLIFAAMPAFWLGLILLLTFSLKLHWFPVTGFETVKHMVLPCFTLAASHMASLVRMTRSTMLEVIRQDYIRTARAKGAQERVIIWKHALKNALLPIITIVGVNFGTLLGGTVIIENVFAINGLGTLLVEGTRKLDTPIVLASTLFAALLAGLINLLVDIMYAVIDPRTKSIFEKK